MPRAPFHLGALQIGKPAIGLPASAGRPLVVVAFASWCIGCVEELPQVVADYKRFKGRVDFLGVDYLDNPTAGRALVKKFGIPFPVVSDRPSNEAAAPVRASVPDPNLTIHLTGVTPAMLPAAVAAMGDRLPAFARPVLLNVERYCKGHSGAQCLAYSSAHHVLLSPGTAVAPHAISAPNAPLPVVSDRPSNDAPAPVQANVPDSSLTIHLNGITPKTLPAIVAQSGNKFPAIIRPILSKVATYCKRHSDAQCLAYASAHHVLLSPGSAVAPHASASPSGKTTSTYLALPHTFVIDAHGIVRADITGYYSSRNPIAEQLRKLGISAP